MGAPCPCAAPAHVAALLLTQPTGGQLRQSALLIYKNGVLVCVRTFRRRAAANPRVLSYTTPQINTVRATLPTLSEAARRPGGAHPGAARLGGVKSKTWQCVRTRFQRPCMPFTSLLRTLPSSLNCMCVVVQFSLPCTKFKRKNPPLSSERDGRGEENAAKQRPPPPHLSPYPRRGVFVGEQRGRE